MSGGFSEVIMPFGKETYRGWKLGAVPNYYLSWCLTQDWLEEKYPNMLEAIQDEVNWRKEQNIHIED